MPGASAPIGMFDSGVGGIAVLAEVRLLLPGEDVIYIADSANFPYGSRPAAFVRSRCAALSQDLIDRGAKLIVVACNTATSAAIAGLRQRFEVPFVGMEPALKPAADRSKAGTVALLVTPGTARGDKLASLIHEHGRDLRIHVIEAPGLAECVERGDIHGAEARTLVQSHANAVRNYGADVLALGCTHYAFIKHMFETELGDGVEVIEPSAAVARQVSRVLGERGVQHPRTAGGTVEYSTTGDAEAFTHARAVLMPKEAVHS